MTLIPMGPIIIYHILNKLSTDGMCLWNSAVLSMRTFIV